MELGEARAIAVRQGATHELPGERRVMFYRPNGDADHWEGIAYFIHPKALTMWLSVPKGLPADATPIARG